MGITRLIIAGILALLLIVGCGSHDEAAESKKTTVAPKLVRIGDLQGVSMDQQSIKLEGISVVKVSEGDLSASMQPTGEVSATDAGTIQITSRLPGKITEANVIVGDHVKKGQVIARVDSVDLANAEVTYQSAVSHATLAKHQLEQQRKLAGYGSLSEQPVEDARKASFAADAAVSSDEAQINVD